MNSRQSPFLHFWNIFPVSPESQFYSKRKMAIHQCFSYVQALLKYFIFEIFIASLPIIVRSFWYV